MNDVLGGMFSSRINMNLREKHGYTYGAFSEFMFYRGDGPFLAGALVRTDVTAPAAEQLMLELSNIGKQPPTADELKLARDQELRSLPGKFETAAETSTLISDLFTYGLPDTYYASLPAQFDSVTAAQVEDAAKTEVHADHVIVVAVGDRYIIEPGLQ